MIERVYVREKEKKTKVRPTALDKTHSFRGRKDFQVCLHNTLLLAHALEAK